MYQKYSAKDLYPETQVSQVSLWKEPTAFPEVNARVANVASEDEKAPWVLVVLLLSQTPDQHGHQKRYLLVLLKFPPG